MHWSTHIRWRSRLTTGFVHGATAMPRRFVQYGISMGILWDFYGKSSPKLAFSCNFRTKIFHGDLCVTKWGLPMARSPSPQWLTSSSDSWRVVEKNCLADSCIFSAKVGDVALDIKTSFKRNLWNMEHSPADVAGKIWRDFTLFGYHFYLQCCLRPNVDQTQTHFGNSHYFSLWGHPQYRSS